MQACSSANNTRLTGGKHPGRVLISPRDSKAVFASTSIAKHCCLQLTLIFSFFAQVETITGTLNNFIVEPFLPHPSHTEYYVCINSAREGDSILFTHEGGVDIGDVGVKALKINIPA